MGRLDGKVALITGAGTGIGREAALLFAREGARIVVAERDVAAGRESEALVREAGGDALFVETDVTESTSARAAVETAVGHYGLVNVLYNNAGGSTDRDAQVTDAPEEEFWRAISLDLFGTFLMCKHGIPALIAAGGGAVVNTASHVALMALRGRDCYTAAKGGVVAITRSMAAEYAANGVRVNAVAPAATRTGRVEKLAADNPHINELVRQGQPLGWVEPIDIAHMALYLASDEAQHTTGQIMPVDSGAIIV